MKNNNNNGSNKNRPTSDFLFEKTYKNQEFLSSPEARQIRILCELTAPKQRFEAEQIENTIVFFGSARSVSMEDAQSNLKTIETKMKYTEDDSDDLRGQLKKAKLDVKLAKYYEKSVELAEKLTSWSMTLPEVKDRFYICSGGGPGMMEASNKGAAKAGGPSIGLNISLPFEQSPNPYQSQHLSFVFHYFFIRKFWFAYLAKALVVFPGGFGTMDELFEVLTLIQTHKIQKTIPIVLFGKEFWEGFMNFDHLVEWGVISEKDLDLFMIFDDVDQAFNYLKEILTEVYL